MVTEKSSNPVTQKRKVTSTSVTQKGKLTRSQKAQQDLAREKSIREESIQAHSVSDATSTNETSSLKEQLAKQNEELKRLRETMEKWETDAKTQQSPISKKTVCVKLHSEGVSSKLSRMTVDMTTELQKKLNLGIVGYIKDEMYSNCKFIKNDMWADVITVSAVEKGYLSVPIGWTEQEFSEHMRREVYKCYARIRHNSQSMARKRFLGKLGYVINLGSLGYVINLGSLGYVIKLGGNLTIILLLLSQFYPDDNLRGGVPKSFPGSLALTENSKGKIGLNPDYRKAASDEFTYFFTRILSAINQSRSKFEDRKHKELISQIYSVMDEAYGLMIIHNEHHVWLEQEEMMKQGLTGQKIKKRKRYCNSSSGKKEGWTKGGVRLFYDLCREVEKRREETIPMEEGIKQSFAQLAGSKATHNQPHIDDIEEERYDPADMVNEFEKIHAKIAADWKESSDTLVGSVVTQMAEL